MSIEISQNAKTIAELDKVENLSKEDIQHLAIPTQLGNANFHILVSEIISLVTKEYLGLDKIQNTSDLEKPISNLMVRALEEKANRVHSHQVQDIVGLSEELLQFFRKNEQIPLSSLDSVVEALRNKADSNHEHQIENIENLSNVLDNKANSEHNHDISQLNGYTELLSRISQMFSGYLKEQDVNTMLSNFRLSLMQEITQSFQNTLIEIPGEW